MVSIGLISLSLLISAVLILSGFFFKKKALFLSMGGSIILVVLGITLLGNGISFINGETITSINNTTSITVVDTLNVQDGITNILSWVIMLLGFAGFIGSTMGLNKLRFDDDEIDDDVFKLQGRF